MFDRRLLANFDWFLVGVTMLICLIGVAAIYSASKGYPGNTHYWLRQLYWIGLGLAAGFVVLLIDFRALGPLAYVLHGLVILALSALLARAGSGEVSRWFDLGPISIQPSEFAKFTTVLAIAYYFRDSQRVGNLGIKGVLVPAALVLVPFYLIVKQPDLGTALLLVIVFLPLIVLAGIRLRLLLYLLAAGALAVVLLVASFQFGFYQVDDGVIEALERRDDAAPVVDASRALEGRKFYRETSLYAAFPKGSFEGSLDSRWRTIEERAFRPFISALLRPYQQRRLITFVYPEHDPLGAGYHVIQSRVAVGSGRFWGKGFGESTQGALNFLPARHTDFIFAIFAEEWGFAGTVVLLGLYAVLFVRATGIILQTRDRFSAFLTLGVLSILVAQVLVNIGMSLGLLPVVGVPLPFFSYGGSSMITMLIGVALMLNIRMRRFLWT
ncbi:MAG: rod shape-determining protein RodA [Candidatus Lambdaproteobacteria bacterium]|nr:rod shape-determining protein RodA [Candidatus Lambdaproteobacteria bacterium]